MLGRVKRYLLNGLMTSLMLLCLGAAGLGVRSLWYGDSAFASNRGAKDAGGAWRWYGCVQSERGRLRMQYLRTDETSDADAGFQLMSDPCAMPQGPSFESEAFDANTAALRPRTPPEWMAFTRDDSTAGAYRHRSVLVVVPHALVAMAAGFAPSLLYIRRKIRRSALPGCCAACGYDLRATPERCPECGSTPGE